MEKIKVETSFADHRGEIIDLLENENINAVTIVTFRSGAVRGNHLHKQTTQWNYVMEGRIKLVSQAPGQDVEETTMEPGDFAATGPNVAHALVGLEDSKVMVFTKGPRGGKEYESDTYRLDIPLVGGTAGRG
jgi:quercetin dioxygenase-like cupin family protein